MTQTKYMYSSLITALIFILSIIGVWGYYLLSEDVFASDYSTWHTAFSMVVPIAAAWGVHLFTTKREGIFYKFLKTAPENKKTWWWIAGAFLVSVAGFAVQSIIPFAARQGQFAGWGFFSTQWIELLIMIGMNFVIFLPVSLGLWGYVLDTSERGMGKYLGPTFVTVIGSAWMALPFILSVVKQYAPADTIYPSIAAAIAMIFGITFLTAATNFSWIAAVCLPVAQVGLVAAPAVSGASPQVALLGYWFSLGAFIVFWACVGIASIIWMVLSARKENSVEKDSEKESRSTVTVVDSQEPAAQGESADTVSVDDKGADSPEDDTVEDDKVTKPESDSTASQSLVESSAEGKEDPKEK